MDRSKNPVPVILACIGACFQLMANHSMAQQEVDDGFEHKVTDPMFEPRKGGLVAIDAGHKNFHTKDGRYKPFANILESDGYIVDAHVGAFTSESLSNIDILVISNALHPDNETKWELPVRSAFSDVEIDAVVDFVSAGGGLFLIADHMPMPGAAAELSARFSIEFSNGYVFEIGEDKQPFRTPSIFQKTKDRIGDHPITRGRHGAENIHQVATFTGSAFPVTGNATSLIRFGENATMLLPTVAWQFDADTASMEIPGWSQGVALKHGDGRVVVFGEAAMFTSQLDAQSASFGLSDPQAKDNQQLLLNIIHWLSHDL